MRFAWLLSIALVAGAQELQLSSASAAAGQQVAIEITLQSPSGKEPVGLQLDLILPGPPLKAADSGPIIGDAGTQAGKTLTCVPKPARDSIKKYSCILVGGNHVIQNGPVALIIFAIPPKTPGGSYPVELENVWTASARAGGSPMKKVHSTITVSAPHKGR